MAGASRICRPYRWLAPIVTAVILLAQLPNPVAGDHGGRPLGSSSMACQRPNVNPPRCRSVGNNFRHFVVFDQTLTEGLTSSLRDTMAEDYDQTNLVMIEQASVNLLTDVIARSEDFGDNGAAGWTNCPPEAPQDTNSAGDRWCRQQHLIFNLNPRYGLFFDDDGSRDHITCHELGHTLGLAHWGNPPRTAGPAAATCMTADTPDGATVLDQIDRDHINAYPAYRPARAVDRRR